MLRTWGPTATTSAHVSRFDTWAVAGMTMPPRDFRSPSALGIWTSTRSISILMGCFSAMFPKVPSTAVPTEAVRLRTSDGLTLEGELAAPDEVRAAAVLAHPHPQFGGNMRSIVIGALFEALPAAGV